jgi:hypothetical protein
MKIETNPFKRVIVRALVLAATISSNATTVEQDQQAHPCCLIMDCTVHYSVNNYFEIFSNNDE